MVSYQYLAIYELSFLAALLSLTYISANCNNLILFLFQADALDNRVGNANKRAQNILRNN